MYNRAITLLVIALHCAAPSRAEPGKAVLPTKRQSEIAAMLAEQLPEEHISHKPVDDALAAAALDNYLEALDPGHQFFLQSDVSRFRSAQDTLDDQLKAGKIDFAYEVYAVFSERVRNRCSHLETLLAAEFDLDKDEYYVWNRRDEPWPADDREWNDLWRKMIKDQYLRPLIAREIGAEDRSGDNTDAGDKEEDAQAPSPRESISKKYKRLLTTIEDNDSEWVLEQYLSAFARAYDPHCDYMSPAGYEDFNIEMQLSLVGIGAVLRPEDGAAKIEEIIPGGPAARDTREKRLQAGDKIIAVAEAGEPPTDILHWPLRKAVRLIRGKKGTTVVLTVIPESDPTGTVTKTVDLVRDEVKLEQRAAKSTVRSVTDSAGTARKLATIDLPAFYGDIRGIRQNEPEARSSANDVGEILNSLKGRHVDGILLDLRNNGGGSLLEAVRLTGLFIESGPIVLVKKTGERRPAVLPDPEPSMAYSGPMVVLVNRLTASASEILAGALQDYGRAVIVGDSKTHGKGTVQAVLPLGDNEGMGSIKVTTALFYRITGSSTQLKGVTPDIVVPSRFDYMEVGEDYQTNPIEWSEVRPMRFVKVGDLNRIVPVLLKKSIERRENDKRFASYRELLRDFEDMQEKNSLSLAFKQRLEQAAERKKLLDTLNEPGAGNDGKDRDAAENDIVLTEGLRILADLASILNPRAKTTPDSDVAEEEK